METQPSALTKLNFFTAAMMGIVGFSLSPEIIQETEISFKGDDIAMLILGIAAIWWYRRQNSNQKLSVTPIVLVSIGLIVKIAAIFLEKGDSEDVGDDIAVAIVMLLTLGVVIWMYRKAKLAVG